MDILRRSWRRLGKILGTHFGHIGNKDHLGDFLETFVGPLGTRDQAKCVSLGFVGHNIQIMSLDFLQRCGYQIKVNTWTGSHINILALNTNAFTYQYIHIN